MSKNIMKKAISSILIIVFMISCVNVAYASENNTTDGEELLYNCEKLPQYFDENISFSEIEAGILDFIYERELNIEKGSEGYVDLMYSFLFGEIENISDIAERYFADYASVYVVKVQELSCQENGDARNTDNSKYDISLEGSIAEARERNSEMMDKLSASYSARKGSSRAGLSLSQAQKYAEMYALSWNYVYGKYSSDCTNFASQILHYAGMEMIKGQWQYNGNELAKRRWNVAHDFMEYWGGEKGYAFNGYVTRSEVNANAKPGDFIGYMCNDTYEVWHVVFVHSKKNGEIYVSQHTANRLNERWNDITIDKPSTYVINRFM